jgi:lysine 2,3-aminomutase
MLEDTFDAEDLEPPGRPVVLGSWKADRAVKYPFPPTGLSDNLARSKPYIQEIPSRSRTALFLKQFFPGASLDDWNDWRWQLRHRIVDIDTLGCFLHLSDDERTINDHGMKGFPMAVTPYYASLLDRENPRQPLRRTVVPTIAEKVCSPGEAIDPLDEDHDSPVPGIVHRYPDRVLFMVTDFCFTHCRYCTRSRLVGSSTKSPFTRAQWERAIAYIESKHAVRDVLISGGDPLTLPDERLEWLLSRLRRIRHVEFLRIGTKAPVVLPQRITSGLTRMLKRYHPLWMSIHFTHPDELTPEVQEACARLADAGIPLGSQTVLLAGVNDDLDTMKRLMHGLLKIRVKPYYLYQCDPIVGSAHFKTPVKKGIEIISGLRGYTSGYAVPTFVIDAPGGGGKIPIYPESMVGRDGDDLLIRNYQSRIYRYPDPGSKLGSQGPRKPVTN